MWIDLVRGLKSIRLHGHTHPSRSTRLWIENILYVSSIDRRTILEDESSRSFNLSLALLIVYTRKVFSTPSIQFRTHFRDSAHWNQATWTGHAAEMFGICNQYPMGLNINMSEIGRFIPLTFLDSLQSRLKILGIDA